MKTKENLEIKHASLEKHIPTAAKPKSLRPMRSLIASRSFKPKTTVAHVIVKAEEEKRV